MINSTKNLYLNLVIQCISESNRLSFAGNSLQDKLVDLIIQATMQTADLKFTLLNDKLLLINLIEKLLLNILSQTSDRPTVPSSFNCKHPPKIAIGEYLKRMGKYAHCSNAAYVIALILIDRYQERQQRFVINSFCIHRLLICALMIGVKWIDDTYYKNEYYAKIGGISREQIDRLELEMMLHFHFSVFISQQQFLYYLQKLQFYQDFSLGADH